MSQLELDAPLRPLARRTDPATSHAAAAKLDVAGVVERIADSLRDDGPATSRELAERLRIDLVTISPRLRPMTRAGMVHEAGKRDRKIVWAFGPGGST